VATNRRTSTSPICHRAFNCCASTAVLVTENRLHIRCQSLEAARAILGIEDICNDNNRFIPCTEHGENWKTHSLNGPMQLLIMHTHTRCLSCPPSAHSSVTALRPRQHQADWEPLQEERGFTLVNIWPLTKTRSDSRKSSLSIFRKNQFSSHFPKLRLTPWICVFVFVEDLCAKATCHFLLHFWIFVKEHAKTVEKPIQLHFSRNCEVFLKSRKDVRLDIIIIDHWRFLRALARLPFRGKLVLYQLIRNRGNPIPPKPPKLLFPQWPFVFEV